MFLVLVLLEGEVLLGFCWGGVFMLKGEVVGLEVWGMWLGGGVLLGCIGEFVSELFVMIYVMLCLWVVGEWWFGGMMVMLRMESG